MQPPQDDGKTKNNNAFKDLQSLLIKEFGKYVQVKSYSVSHLLPPEENLGSLILKIDAVIERESGALDEDLHLVAKVFPTSEYSRYLFDSFFTFNKEIFFYETLIPSYKSLELEFEIPEEEVFDIVPKVFGIRRSLRSESDDVDDDAAILLENLKCRGFYVADRRSGLDLNHSKAAVRALAKFHALGMAVKLKKPEKFETIRLQAKCMEFKQGGFFEMMEFVTKGMLKDPELEKYSARIEKAVQETEANNWSAIPSEPWSTIIHSDFWVNNVMFHQDAEGNIDDIKFVDFQNYLFLSPLRELVFFLCTSNNLEVMTNDLDELLDTYHEVLVSVLKSMKCEVKQFSKEKFEAQLKIDAYLQFAQCPFMLKVITSNDSSLNQIQDIMMTDNVNSLYTEKLHKLIEVYVNRGWL